MQRWTGRVALVTGACSGIGASTVRKLLEHGLAVIGCDVDEAKLDELKGEISADKQGRFDWVECDLRKEEQILDMFSKIKAEFGGIDVCVNSAGVGYKAPVLDGATTHFKEMFDVNVLAYILCTRESVRQMMGRGVDDGQVIFISSMAAHRVRTETPAHCDFTVYNATKHALKALVEGIRHELRVKKSNIRIAMVSPGIVETPFTHKMYPDDGPTVDKLYRSMQCLQPDDVADEVIHILSRPPHVNVQDVWVLPTEQS